MWRELLELKTFRERQAQTALARRRGELAAARQAARAACTRLAEHRRFADEHERSLYGDLLRRTVKLRDIETVQQTVATLRVAAERLDDTRRQAEAAEASATQQAQAAADVHRRAEQVREKFVQLATLHAAELLREAERGEDLEMEEVATLRREREEWSDADDGEPAP